MTGLSFQEKVLREIAKELRGIRIELEKMNSVFDVDKDEDVGIDENSHTFGKIIKSSYEVNEE